jgi:hypothetical protein
MMPLVKEITKDTEGLRLPAFAYKPPDYTNEECIEMIKFLPDHVMQHEHGIWLGSGNTPGEKKFIQAIRKKYNYLAEWLEYYVLTNTENLPELSNPNTEKHHYKPIAEKSLATLKLIKEVCAFCQWLNAEKLCINRWWLACEWELCVNLLSCSGYTGEPTVIGGRKIYSDTIELEKELDSKTIQKSVHENMQASPMQASPMQALEGLSYLISQGKDEDNMAFNHTHFASYKKSIKSCLRRLSKSSKINPAYIIDGEYVVMRQGKPNQKRIVK